MNSGKMFFKSFFKLNKNFNQLCALKKHSLAATENQDLYSTLEPKHIEAAIKFAPVLSTVSPELWRTAHDTFQNHGLNTISFLKIVTGNPSVLKRSPKKIIESLENWRNCQFGEYFLHLLIVKYPDLLDIADRRLLLTHTAFLRTIFGTNKNVWKVLMNSPDLMEQSETKIDKKFKYIQEKMRIEVSEIIKSQALSKDLEEIQCRHIFLERLGVFKPRPLKADPNLPSKNPRLYQITDTSEKAFATKICKVTYPEYEVFKELFKKELERFMYDEEEDDLLSDEDK